MMRMSERQFVEFLRSEAKPRTGKAATGFSKELSLREGIGDDCAVIGWTRKNDLLITTDMLLEDIHFRRDWQTAKSAGYKALARGLSDIAAMGGTPRLAFLSLALSKETRGKWAKEFVRGFLALAKTTGVQLAGGDTGASPGGVFADVMVIGEAPRGKAILRSGARAGDEIWVTGKLGGAAATLNRLRRGKAAQFYPAPRLEIGRMLRERGLASAMIDLSDGLSIDLARLCERSGVGAVLVEKKIPRAAGASLQNALHGGEDLELLFTVAARKASQVPRAWGGVALTRIGEIVGGRKIWLESGGGESVLPVKGFQHF